MLCQAGQLLYPLWSSWPWRERGVLGAGFFVERLSNQYSLLKTDKEQTATYANLLPFGVPPLKGCGGGRTRTGGLWVMSPAIYQLIYPTMF